jgi:hypothetical protein
MSEELEMNMDDVDSDQAEAYVEAFYPEDDDIEEDEEAEYLGDRCVFKRRLNIHGREVC